MVMAKQGLHVTSELCPNWTQPDSCQSIGHNVRFLCSELSSYSIFTVRPVWDFVYDQFGNIYTPIYIYIYKYIYSIKINKLSLVAEEIIGVGPIYILHG